MATYVYNSYFFPSRLFVEGGEEIQSLEGTTQGDTFAMPSYAIGITPLLTGIRDENNVNVKHAAYADDLGGAGKLSELRAWWDKINEIGPLL